MRKAKTIMVFMVLVLAVLVLPVCVYAQTSDELNHQYRQLLITLINLLVEQVKNLTQQLAVLQAEQVKLANQPPAIPTIIFVTENPVVKEKVVSPKVELRARSSYPDKPASIGGNFESYKTTWINQGETLTIGEALDPSGSWQNGDLGIFIGIGNPDRGYSPKFECWKFGVWTGKVDPLYDHWEEKISVKEGEYGVACGMPGYYSDGRVYVKIVH